MVSALLHALPFVMLAYVTLFYSSRIISKVHIQAATLVRRTPLPPYDNPGPIDCKEIARSVVGSPKLFVYSEYDYWFYEHVVIPRDMYNPS